MKYLVLFYTLFMISCSSIPTTDKAGEPSTSASNPKEIVFIHGMFVNSKSWSEWEKYFKAAGYKVSAPDWPLHDVSLTEQRQKNRFEALGKLELTQVVDHYRQILKGKNKPIVIGHSMGGLIAQILLTEGLASAAVAIDSAPPNGMIVFKWSFIKANWGAISPFASLDEPIDLSVDQFSYAFLNAQPEEKRQSLYNEYYVPESRRIGKGPTLEIAKIDPNTKRGPLLIIAGGDDHIIPAKLNFKNFKMYEKSPAYTEFKLFEGRDHWTLGGAGWEKVADHINSWLNARFGR